MTASLFTILSFFLSISLVLTCVFPTPLLARKLTKTNDLNRICSKTQNSTACFHLLSPNLRSKKHADDSRAITQIAAKLAFNKALEIKYELHKLYQNASKANSRLKRVYISCSKNYNDVVRDLDLVKRNLDIPRHYRNIPIQVNDAFEEVWDCVYKVKLASGSAKQLYLKKRNGEFLFLLGIVRHSSNYLLIKTRN